MRVAISIVGFKNSDDIVKCLSALDKCDYRDFQVIICENGGLEAYDQLIASLPSSLEGGQDVRVIAAPSNLGYAGGVNVCLRETPDADAWWILNPDTQPHPGALSALVARLSMGDCDAVGGTTHFEDGTVEAFGGRWRPWLARAESIGNGAPVERPVSSGAIELKISYISGASMLVGRGFVEAVGPMNESYFLYCEEVEWCLRGAQIGMRLGFAPGGLVLHHQGTTTGSGLDIRTRPRLPVFLDERNKLLVTRDCYPARLPIAAIAAMALLFLRFGRRRAWRQLGYGLEGWFAGLLGRRGRPSWLQA
ncbi:glycosyltransferase [Phenylobacterium sp.]|uniref:glycosyltransferase n=1 Tax=Phenylobacterium sp. TaxID=1871053 RepID=UPI00272FD41E|nr:glycosyltransferase family 2 protein [Phenylobacterium sp.]MDP1598234.1 glycosyltransferase family 2 protein [Phenylobacterium sp.]MDP3594702.1 glycosyltransferase family 2 protein [Phenylobacterium sp.]